MSPIDKPAIGIRRHHRGGWLASVRVKGALRHKVFPPDADLASMKEWRKDQRALAQLDLSPSDPSVAGTLAADCATYLAAVRGMPTYRDRAYRIQQWRDALGAKRRRASITSVEIRQQLETWKADGLSHGSLNLRRTALMHLWTVLDGKSARNPVKDVPRYRESIPTLRLPSLAVAQRVIAKVPGKGKKGRTRARLSVLLWTGWPARQLARLEPRDVDWKGGTAIVRGRLKGKGTPDRRLPLLPQAVAALKTFAAIGAWGHFSTSSMHSALHRACKLAKVPPFRPYDLRHLFLTNVALATRDDRVVAELGLHADIRQTRRYTTASVNPRVLAGLQAVSRTLRRPPKAGRSSPKTGKPARTR